MITESTGWKKMCAGDEAELKRIKDCQPCSVWLGKSLNLIGEAIHLCPQPQQEKDRCIH